VISLDIRNELESTEKYAGSLSFYCFVQRKYLVKGQTPGGSLLPLLKQPARTTLQSRPAADFPASDGSGEPSSQIIREVKNNLGTIGNSGRTLITKTKSGEILK
jgi:hypothetical protein